jgi:GTPase SAR1 family protein
MVFDINKPSTFHNAINKWYAMARAKCPDASFMLIANKIDLTSNIDEAEAARWTKMNNVLYVKTSVKEGINV